MASTTVAEPSVTDLIDQAAAARAAPAEDMPPTGLPVQGRALPPTRPAGPPPAAHSRAAAPAAVPAPAAPPTDPLSAEQRTAAEHEKMAGRVQELALEEGKTREALQASKEAEAYAHFQDKIADFKTESTKRMAAAEKHLGDERQRYADMRITDFWENKSTASHVLAALSVGLGQFASALTGTPNAAMHILDTAVENHRKQQEALLKKQEKQIEMSESDRHFAQIEIQNQEAGMYQAFATEREKMLRAAGYTDKMIAADQTQAALVAKAAEKGTAVADKAQQSIKDHEEMKLKQFTAQTQAQLAKAHSAEAYAGAAAHRAGIKKTEAETRKIDAETAAIGAGGVGGKGGKAASKMLDLATQGAMLGEDQQIIDEAIRTGNLPTTEELNKAQDKASRIKSAEHDNTAVGAFVTGGLRGVGLAPRQAYEHMPKEKQEVMLALGQGAMKAAGVFEKSSAEGAQERAAKLFMPQGGDPPNVIRRKIESQRMMGHIARALAGGYGPAAQAAAEEARNKGLGLDAMVSLGRQFATQAGEGQPAGGRSAAVPTTAEKSKAIADLNMRLRSEKEGTPRWSAIRAAIDELRSQ
jgi:hypothetical protein